MFVVWPLLVWRADAQIGQRGFIRSFRRRRWPVVERATSTTATRQRPRPNTLPPKVQSTLRKCDSEKSSSERQQTNKQHTVGRGASDGVQRREMQTRFAIVDCRVQPAQLLRHNFGQRRRRVVACRAKRAKMSNCRKKKNEAHTQNTHRNSSRRRESQPASAPCSDRVTRKSCER